MLTAILPALLAGAACVLDVFSPLFVSRPTAVPGLIAYDLLTLARAVIMSTAGLLIAVATARAWRDWRARRQPQWSLAVVGGLWFGLMLVLEPFFSYLSFQVGGLP